MKMGLLKSVDNVPGIDFYDYREGQYYGKYEFRMRVSIPCVRYLWFCKTPEDLDAKLIGKSRKYGFIRAEDKKTVSEHAAAIKALITLQTTRRQTQDLGLRVESQTVALFSNSLQKLKDLETVIGTQYEYDYTQIQTANLIGTKHFVKEPKFKYRVYLKSKRIDASFAAGLKKIIDNNTDLHPSTALTVWLKGALMKSNLHSWRYRFCSSSYYIDYNDDSMLSYLALMHDNMLGKRYKLEKRPDPV
jgi:hypothetical protein